MAYARRISIDDPKKKKAQQSGKPTVAKAAQDTTVQKTRPVAKDTTVQNPMIRASQVISPRQAVSSNPAPASPQAGRQTTPQQPAQQTHPDSYYNHLNEKKVTKRSAPGQYNTEEEENAMTLEGYRRINDRMYRGIKSKTDGSPSKYYKIDLNRLSEEDRKKVQKHLNIGTGMLGAGREPGSVVIKSGFHKGEEVPYWVNPYQEKNEEGQPLKEHRYFLEPNDPVPMNADHYRQIMMDKAIPQLTPADMAEIRRRVAMGSGSSDNTPEENLRFTQENYIERDQGGFPDYDRVIDYSEYGELPEGFQIPEERTGIDEKEISDKVAADMAAKEAAKRNTPEYKKWKESMAQVAANKNKRDMRQMRGQSAPGRPNDNMRVNRFNDRFSGRPGSQNRPVGPRVVRRRMGN